MVVAGTYGHGRVERRLRHLPVQRERHPRHHVRPAGQRLRAAQPGRPVRPGRGGPRPAGRQDRRRRVRAPPRRRQRRDGRRPAADRTAPSTASSSAPAASPGSTSGRAAHVRTRRGRCSRTARSSWPASIGGSFAVVRLNANGTLDTSFDGDGWCGDDVQRRRQQGLRRSPSQPDGKIVAAGYTERGVRAAQRFVVARYNTDGSPDADVRRRRQGRERPRPTPTTNGPPTSSSSRTARSSWRPGSGNTANGNNDFAVAAATTPTARSTPGFGSRRRSSSRRPRRSIGGPDPR